MKTIIFATTFLLGAALSGAALTPQEALQRISWYGQSSLRIELGGKLIWIDPVGVPVTEKADIILITHSHADHFSMADIKKLSGPATLLLAGFDAANGKGLARIKPGDSRKVDGLLIEAVSAYNIVKSGNHPKASLFCGFILSAEGVRIYDAGDTERIPEMKDITCDIVFLPLGQTYTMGSVDEAVQAALDVKAKIAIPFHYGLYEGTEKDADDFVAALKEKGVQALRLPKK
jgi:L-ascorbate metabolism protein UlaG (beta-lactamase superfamily)